MSQTARRGIALLLGLALVGVAIAAWSQTDNSRPTQSPGETTVAAAEKEPGKLPSTVEATARPVWVRPAHGADVHAAAETERIRITRQPAHIEPFEETAIYAKAAGFVSTVRVDLGSRVKAGDVLAELWIPEMEQDLAQKRALVEEAEAAVGQAEAAIVAAEAGIAAAAAKVRESRAEIERTRAEVEFRAREHARFADLVERKALEQALLDERLKQWHSAKAAVAAAEAGQASAEANERVDRAKLKQAQANLTLAQSRLKVAQANLKQVEVLMDYRIIRAPYDGVVTERGIDTGDFAQSATDSKSAPLFALIRAQPFRIVADIPEADAAWIRPGLPATLTVDGIADRVFKGAIKRQSDLLDPRTRTLRIEVELNDSDDRLRCGMYGFVEVKESESMQLSGHSHSRN